MEGELFDRKVLEQLTAGALRRECRSRGAQEDFLDPESGRDPTKEDLLTWLQANWGVGSKASEPEAGSSEEDLELGAGGAGWGTPLAQVAAGLPEQGSSGAEASGAQSGGLATGEANSPPSFLGGLPEGQRAAMAREIAAAMGLEAGVVAAAVAAKVGVPPLDNGRGATTSSGVTPRDNSGVPLALRGTVAPEVAVSPLVAGSGAGLPPPPPPSPALAAATGAQALLPPSRRHTLPAAPVLGAVGGSGGGGGGGGGDGSPPVPSTPAATAAPDPRIGQLIQLVQNLATNQGQLQANVQAERDRVTALELSHAEQAEADAARIRELETQIAEMSAEAKKGEDTEEQELFYVPHFNGLPGTEVGTSRGEPELKVNPYEHGRRPGAATKPIHLNLRGNECYDELRRMKKTGQYHEMATIYSVNSFFWDALVYADDWAPIWLGQEDSGASAEEKAGSFAQFINTLRECYAIMLRRLNLIELQTKKESKNSNFQLTALEKKTLTFLEERISGMSANLGLCCDIDPLFQKLLLEFTDKAEAATLTSLTKAIGATTGGGGGGGGKQKKKVGGPKPKAAAGAKLNVKIDTAGAGRS